jgi:hypothetical protein
MLLPDVQDGNRVEQMVQSEINNMTRADYDEGLADINAFKEVVFQVFMNAETLDNVPENLRYFANEDYDEGDNTQTHLRRLATRLEERLNTYHHEIRDIKANWNQLLAQDAQVTTRFRSAIKRHLRDALDYLANNQNIIENLRELKTEILEEEDTFFDTPVKRDFFTTYWNNFTDSVEEAFEELGWPARTTNVREMLGTNNPPGFKKGGQVKNIMQMKLALLDKQFANFKGR